VKFQHLKIFAKHPRLFSWSNCFNNESISLQYKWFASYFIQKIVNRDAMKNKFTIILDDKVCGNLREIFKDDDEAIIKFVVQAINNELERCGGVQSSSRKNSEGLEDYLQSGDAGSRNYGIKGQGW